MKILHLNVKKEYFDDFLNGKKLFEYRLVNRYWINRLLKVHYDFIYYKCGYPKNGDMSKIRVIPYRGYEVEKILHKHFGDQLVRVFSIRLVD